MEGKGRKGMKARYLRYSVVALSILLAAGLMMVVVSGCGGGEMSIEEIWEKSEEADQSVTSLHMEVNIYYQNTQYGGGLIQNTSIDVSGDNVHAQSSIFGQSFSEVIRVGGQQYSRYLGSDEWAEEPVSISAESVTSQISQFSTLPSVASSSENTGEENVGGVQTYHLSFTLSPQTVSSLFTDVPAEQLSANSGGTVDVWIDTGNFYKVKYEALISNVLITEEIGYGDVRIETTITNINQPITITPPQ
jgi:hypothetical protein